MAIDTVALVLAGALGLGAPADAPPSASMLAGLTLDYGRIAQPVAADIAPEALALAKSCSDSWWKMSGIQLVTCMIAHPDDTFGPSDEQS
jgi:hypothetical protein